MIEILVEASVRSLVIAGLVGALLAVTRPQRGTVRHAAWAVVVAAMLVSPLAVLWRPTLPVQLPHVTPFAKQADSELPVEPFETATTALLPAASTALPQGGPTAPTLVSPVPSPTEGFTWVGFVSTVWLAGFVLFVLRLSTGWLQAHRLGTSATPVDLPFSVPVRTTVFECQRVVVPVLIGFLRPRILLPAEWRTWSRASLDAVLAHEGAHAGRCDNLTTLIAQFNRSVFWFHPLAWWLESILARSAEQACDDAVLDGARDNGSYADLLVTMASKVRVHGTRVLGPAAGMAGRGRLESRIDRILGGRTRPISIVRTITLCAGAATVIASGLACQQQPAPLKPNAEYTAIRTAQRDRYRHVEGVEKMTRQDLEALESAVLANPDDLKAVERLLAAYDRVGQALFGWNDMVTRRRPVLEQLVERHPESEVAARTLVRQHDPTGYAVLERVWLAHVAKPGVEPRVIGNAAEFFRASDKPRSEALLKRAADLEPDGPQPRTRAGVYYPAWRSRLGVLYAQAILGATDGTTFNVLRSFSVEEAQGSYAAQVRRTLETTTDVVVLTAAGGWLMNSATQAQGKLPFDPHALGRSLVDRASNLDPSATNARLLRDRDDYNTVHRRAFALSRELRTRPDAFAELSDRDRFMFGTEIAHILYVSTEDIEKDPTRVREAMARVKTTAEDALGLAPRFRDAPDYGRVVFEGNCVLGLIALRDGDRRKAVEHLTAAAATPGSASMASGVVDPSRLPTYLLHAGERESVVAFYERLAELDKVGREQWLKNAGSIRAGEMTWAYQATFGPKVGS